MIRTRRSPCHRRVAQVASSQERMPAAVNPWKSCSASIFILLSAPYTLQILVYRRAGEGLAMPARLEGEEQGARGIKAREAGHSDFHGGPADSNGFLLGALVRRERVDQQVNLAAPDQVEKVRPFLP